ncbi:MAG: DUF4149 domain-containing protein [Candidatus Acidiferrales bacterium]
MTHILRFVQVFALGTWLGAIIYLSFVVAPGVFGTLANRDQAGAVVGLVLGRLHHLGVIAAVIYLVAGLGLGRSLKALIQPAALGVILMLLLTLASQRLVTPRLASLRTDMVSVDATPRDNPLRIEFDRLHRISVQLEGAVLVIGIVALFLTVRAKGS